MASLTIDALLELWLADLRANDLAPGTVRRYRSCTGYLDHPFKKYGRRDGKDLLSLLANTGQSV